MSTKVNIPVMQEVRDMNLIVRDREPKTYEFPIQFPNDTAVSLTVSALLQTVKSSLENSPSDPGAAGLNRVLDLAMQLMPHAELSVFNDYKNEIRIIRKLLKNGNSADI